MKTAYCYDSNHAQHAPVSGLPFKPGNYLDLCHEIPERLESLRNALGNAGLLSNETTIRVTQTPATDAELLAPALGGGTNNDPLFYSSTVHNTEHIGRGNIQFGDHASYVVDGTEDAARLAAGGVLAVARAVCEGRARNGFALVRPPGHHSCCGCGMVQGFCVFNNVAVAVANARVPSPLSTKSMSSTKGAKGAKDDDASNDDESATNTPRSRPPVRSLVVDFDAHHGDGVQQIFYRDQGVLYVSVHRGAFDPIGKLTEVEGGREKGFFPGTGLAKEVGDGKARGFNVNIPFEEIGMGDAEYRHVFGRVIMPIAKAFAPDVVYVCAGFDAARGDEKSAVGFGLIPRSYHWMVSQLMELAEGRVVLALEGGYDLDEICACGVACMRALQGLPMVKNDETKEDDKKGGGDEEVHPHAIETVRRVIEIQGEHWPCLLNNGRSDDNDDDDSSSVSVSGGFLSGVVVVVAVVVVAFFIPIGYSLRMGYGDALLSWR